MPNTSTAEETDTQDTTNNTRKPNNMNAHTKKRVKSFAE